MSRLEDALSAKKVDRIPIWFMRQAGRYLPEYQEIRKQYTFWQMVTTPELASEVTLQPIKRFDLDAAIIFSDIMVILHGLGFNVSFEHGPPEVSPALKTEAELDKLIASYSAEKMIESLDFYQQSLTLTRKGLAQDKALIGFAAAPFTLASYIVEGKTSKTHAKIRALMFEDPKFFKKLCDFIVLASIDYLKMQIDCGISAVQIFDSWGDIVDPTSYDQAIMPHNEKLIKEISKHTKTIFFCRGASIHYQALDRLYDQGVSALSVDWRADLTTFKKPVQGNLDPAYLFTNPEVVKAKVTEILKQRANQPGFIFNLGHGIQPETPVENVKAMVETVQQFKLD